MNYEKVGFLFLPRDKGDEVVVPVPSDRVKFRDSAGVVFKFRMNAGSPGEVNRSHPCTIEPALIDASAPPTAYGQAVVVDPTTQGVRPLVAGDSALTDIYGITVRPYPLQQNSASPSLGAATPPTSGVIDVLRSGYILVQGYTGISTVKGGNVYIIVSVTSGVYVQGYFSATSAPGGSTTIEITGNDKTSFNGTQDAVNVVEVAFNV